MIRPPPPPPPDPDRDDDGIPNQSDSCPDDPEDGDGYQDSDGCPDPGLPPPIYNGTVVACDLDGDGLEDLIVGEIGADLPSAPDAGALSVLYGAPAELVSDRRQHWHQDSPGVAGGAEPSDLFGASLACGDFNGDGYGDLAVGFHEKTSARSRMPARSTCSTAPSQDSPPP